MGRLAPQPTPGRPGGHDGYRADARAALTTVPRGSARTTGRRSGSARRTRAGATTRARRSRAPRGAGTAGHTGGRGRASSTRSGTSFLLGWGRLGPADRARRRWCGEPAVAPGWIVGAGTELGAVCCAESAGRRSRLARQTPMPESRPRTRFIFVTGGVVSSLGKGIAAASIGRLLVSRGLKVALQKFDPYINVDPGTMSPFQHGEVFVTEDGA